MLSLYKLLTLCTLALALFASVIAAEGVASNKRVEITFERRDVTEVFARPGAAVGKPDAAPAADAATATPAAAPSNDIVADEDDEEWGQDSFDDDDEDFTIISQFAALEKRGKRRYSGKGTYFYPGLGNCGGWSGNNDLMVAVPTSMYGGGKHCNKWMRICSSGKCVNAQVKDSCPSCSWGSLDLSPRAFKALAPLSRGVISVTWNYL
ncbi:uncharacterized protein PFL1_05015 [Pseudozyma flocculosa PF-1]|uniref:RlpA-like protein double-psi beta-barrel domain-containing protein n=2 Tax=Pseudozyma flocculosa TaxID=84751 RepID=A0A5C3EVL1_9BASI|nr:uncharacterized protein PFL1_05015 [Pseudozyma flocculosa PF-1]EPQ27477.1 hypothetical protein PFL1_05015 [Pseudozyma flocculosa PF-1]SPO36092.1 uncharacterized protein PSFLO_01563 [Pseudozyma flocculosa]